MLLTVSFVAISPTTSSAQQTWFEELFSPPPTQRNSQPPTDKPNPGPSDRPAPELAPWLREGENPNGTTSPQPTTGAGIERSDLPLIEVPDSALQEPIDRARSSDLQRNSRPADGWRRSAPTQRRQREFQPFENRRREAGAIDAALDAAPADNAARRTDGAIENRQLSSDIPAREAASSDYWRGTTSAQLLKAIAALSSPPSSTIVAQLWRDALTQDAEPESAERDFAENNQGRDAAPSSDIPFLAIRLEALARAGRLDDAKSAYASARSQPQRQHGPRNHGMSLLVAAGVAVASGDAQTACELSERLAKRMRDLSDNATKQALFLKGLCARQAGDSKAVQLIAQLARDGGLPDGPGLKALETTRLPQSAKLRGKSAVIGPVEAALWLSAGGAAQELLQPQNQRLDTLFVVLNDDATPLPLQAAVAERLARANALPTPRRAILYSRLATRTDRPTSAIDKRAKAFQAAVSGAAASERS
ncbi:MAG: hypothetical protein AAGG72_01725, partial [Pseudomonadota bacterium]